MTSPTELTWTDLFCGAGGSSSGLKTIAGTEIRQAANHWSLAVETHNANHPEADHDCADISQVDPRRYPRTTFAWISPECTNHSQAKGTKRAQGPDLFGQTLPEEAAERSRATMWDVCRFAEHHRYQGFIVENVVDAAKWVSWRGWRITLQDMGYCLHTVFLNSMFAGQLGAPAPQSRDRMYVVAHRSTSTCPDLDRWTRPQAYCPTCDQVVAAVQAWKKPTPWGRYRSQYVWRCPHTTCRNAVLEPSVIPAAAAIDWSIPGERIGDRAEPLASKTRARIEAGLRRYARPVHLEAHDGQYDATDPRHPAMLVPVEGRTGKAAAPVTDPMRTTTTRAETGLCVPPFVVELRGGGSTTRPASAPLATLTAGGTHHGLLVPAGGTWNAQATSTDDPLRALTTREAYALVMRHNTGGAEMSTPVSEPLRTLTTTGHQSLLTGQIAEVPEVEDCYFRMLLIDEIRAGMSFEAGYLLQGTKREKVRMLGNAVTPCAARDLGAALVESLGCEVALAS